MPVIPIDEILLAQRSLRPHVGPSALIPRSSGAPGDPRWLCKMEALLPTRSFKVRGALHFLGRLEPEVLRRGVVTGSSTHSLPALAPPFAGTAPGGGGK